MSDAYRTLEHSTRSGRPAAGYHGRRRGESKADARRRRGLLRPIRCPACRVYTEQIRIERVAPHDMLRHIVVKALPAERRCQACGLVFRDVRSGAPRKDRT
jgi:hypothetical protein